ncbi:MAG: type II toxin-antitoxin system prevent-host-death family antitoxin [Acidobacteriota bacterium]|nr:type II toxin-antitoxin system prevent-host-death family antitoxin [Acidobacteriota bacterium]
MTRSVSSATANRDFSALLRKVRGGATFTVTSHGRPVARIVPVATGAPVTRSARKTLFDRLAATRPVSAGRWTRNELYEDGK